MKNNVLKKLLSLVLTLFILTVSAFPIFANSDENQSTEPGEWFYTDFGFPEEYVREDPQTVKTYDEKLWLPKAPYAVVYGNTGIWSSYELPDHEKNVEYFKNEAPLIMILCPSENAVQYSCQRTTLCRQDGITLTQAKVVKILRNTDNEQISEGDTVWIQEEYLWYTNEDGVDVFTSPYGARCKPLHQNKNYLVQATRVKEATKEDVFSIGEYFWNVSDTGSYEYFKYIFHEKQWLYCSFWEIDAYKEDVVAHFNADAIETEKAPSLLPFIIGGASILIVSAATVSVIVFTRKRGHKKAAPTAD